MIRANQSYGGPAGLFELAVMKGTSFEYSELTYDTPITNDVLGHLTEDDVTDLLEKVSQL